MLFSPGARVCRPEGENSLRLPAPMGCADDIWQAINCSDSLVKGLEPMWRWSFVKGDGVSLEMGVEPSARETARQLFVVPRVRQPSSTWRRLRSVSKAASNLVRCTARGARLTGVSCEAAKLPCCLVWRGHWLQSAVCSKRAGSAGIRETLCCAVL